MYSSMYNVTQISIFRLEFNLHMKVIPHCTFRSEFEQKQCSVSCMCSQPFIKYGRVSSQMYSSRLMTVGAFKSSSCAELIGGRTIHVHNA
jgi:hypothetical protein